MPKTNMGFAGYLAYMRDDPPFMEGDEAERASLALDFAIAMYSPGYVPSDEAIRAARSTLGVVG